MLFVLGTAETFADTTAATLLPMVVAPTDLGIGNARMMAGRITINQMAGPPIGAALFATGMAWPFAVNVVCVLLGASLISRIALSTGAHRDEAAQEPARQAVVAGVRWLWHHPPVRTLALTILTFNVTFGAAWAVLVPLGGLLADLWGLTAPFVFAFIGSAIILVLIWPQLGHIAHADGATQESAGADGGLSARAAQSLHNRARALSPRAPSPTARSSSAAAAAGSLRERWAVGTSRSSSAQCSQIQRL